MKILTTNMLLKKLIKNLSKENKEIEIKGLAIDSQKVKKDFIFFAIKGHKYNGENYINEAVLKGANVIICSEKCKYKNNKVIIIKSKEIRSLLSDISSKFYKLKPKNIIAVTGTNGKTSVADLFYQILKLNNKNVASIGTLGTKYKNQIFRSKLTTPDTITIHQILEKLKKNKIENVIIEASSHGLDQRRIDHLPLKAGIFTNFSQDHLDYHKSMRAYLNAKLFLFRNILKKKKTIIFDKNIKESKILENLSKKKQFRLVDISQTKEKLKKIVNLHDFQLNNLSMAVAAAKICKLKEKKILNSLTKLKDVNGRMELVRTFPNNIKVYVDFAHTPDALLKSLHALKSNQNKIISLVFGCGGDRDLKKRPIMAKIASKHCDKIYITDDNPRNEKPEKIRKEIIKNIKNKNCFNIGDRSEAIKTSILNAQPNEIILVAGKGHEIDQEYKNKTIFISDKQIVKKLKIKFKKKLNREQTFLQNKKILREIKKRINIKNFHGLAIDSRVVKKGNLFLTIKGKKNNGKKFISNALKKGAQGIVSSQKIKNYKKLLINVPNELKFLNNFAFKKRSYSKAKILAITGSSGKTSLKDLIKKLLSNFGNTYCSPKSYNNHFGVPLSLSNLDTSHKFGVFEVGMSKAGEINKLSKLIRPHIGIITNIGEAHIENFKNLRGIADAKGEIINNITVNGTVLLNRDDKFFSYLKKKAKLRNLKIISFGMSNKSNIYPISIKKKKGITELKIKLYRKIQKFETKNINIYNLLSALALLEELNLDLSKIKKSLKSYELTEGRGKIHNVRRYNKKFKLIDESYNANPLSVKNAIKNLNSIKKQNFKKYLILGDMLELGQKSIDLHKKISKVINNSDIDKVFIKGDKTLITFKNIKKTKRGNIFQQDTDVDFALNNIIANNDYLMIKGSNATGLHKLSKRIIKGF
tara:strand:- start:877 stop:3654 length:2778 start_codon:yes stop_codon:yes gene_type:complete